MRDKVLIVSQRIESRVFLKNALRGLNKTLLVRIAHSQEVALKQMQENSFKYVLIDQETESGLLDAVEPASAGFSSPLFILLERGAKRALKKRHHPHTHLQVILPDFSNPDDLIDLLKPHIAAAEGTLGAGSGGAARVFGQRVNTRHNPHLFRPAAVVIGSSTGGPEALERLFSALKVSLSVPIFLTQHTPIGFSRMLVSRLRDRTGFDFVEARNYEIVQPGKVYVAPGDVHMSLRSLGDEVKILLSDGPFINSVRPAVDPLFSTAAEIYQSSLAALVLTGMGEDGLRGCHDVKNYGGLVGIQSRESCVVFGMPGAVFEAGLHDYQATPEDLAVILGRQLTLAGGQSKSGSKLVSELTFSFIHDSSSSSAHASGLSATGESAGSGLGEVLQQTPACLRGPGSGSLLHTRVDDVQTAVPAKDSPSAQVAGSSQSGRVNDKLLYFASVIEKETGIQYSEVNLYQLENRLNSVARDFKLSGLEELHRVWMTGKTRELERRLLETASNHETSFFRDASVFSAVEHYVLPKLKSLGGGIRIWSNACSSGQEAISLAILCEEAEISNYEIFCTDISDAILKRARAGLFHDIEIARGLSADRKSRYFVEVTAQDDVSSRWQVSPSLLRKLRFQNLNLLAEWPQVGKFDLIFMRNVLIYQSIENKRKCIAKVRKCLQPHGYLFLGSSESLIGLSDDFSQVENSGSLFYRPDSSLGQVRAG